MATGYVAEEDEKEDEKLAKSEVGWCQSEESEIKHKKILKCRPLSPPFAYSAVSSGKPRYYVLQGHNAANL